MVPLLAMTFLLPRRGAVQTLQLALMHRRPCASKLHLLSKSWLWPSRVSERIS